jgi:hypothetical protein
MSCAKVNVNYAAKVVVNYAQTSRYDDFSLQSLFAKKQQGTSVTGLGEFSQDLKKIAFIFLKYTP